MSRKKKRVEPPPPPPEPVVEVAQQPVFRLHEELGLVSPNHPDQFLAVRLVGVTSDCFFVRDEAHDEEMEFSRATGHRRKAPTPWDFWHLPEEELRILNRSEWRQ